MRRDFEGIKLNMDFQKSEHHFQNLRDIGNNKAEHKASNCVSGENRHCNRKADVGHHKKNACDYG